MIILKVLTGDSPASSRYQACMAILADAGMFYKTEKNTMEMMKKSRGKMNPVNGFVIIPPDDLPFNNPICDPYSLIEWILQYGLQPL